MSFFVASNSSRDPGHNNTELPPSQLSAAPLHQFLDIAKMMWMPIATVALSAWAFSLLSNAPSFPSLIGAIPSNTSLIDRHKLQLPPSLHPTLSIDVNLICTLGLLALGTGRWAGLTLLSQCLKFPGVQAFSPNTTFATTLGGAATLDAYSIQPNGEQGAIVSGYTTAGGGNLVLTNLAENGTALWMRALGGSNAELKSSVQKISDNKFIATTYTSSFGKGGIDILLAEVFRNGTLSSAKTLGTASNEGGKSIQITQDGGRIIAGFSDGLGLGMRDVLLVKVDATNTISWQTGYGSSSWEEAEFVLETQDGRFITVGYTDSFGAGNKDLLVSKFTGAGSLSWARTLGGSWVDEGFGAEETQDGGVVVIGNTQTTSSSPSKILVAKYTSAGTFSWATALKGEGASHGKAIKKTANGDLIITGSSNDKLLIAKLNATGSVSWAKTLRAEESSIGHSIQAAESDRFLVTGKKGSNMFVTKFDSNGHIVNCYFLQPYNLTSSDITSWITPGAPSFSIATPSLLPMTWETSAISEFFSQNITCPKSLSVTPSVPRSASMSPSLGSHSLTASPSRSLPQSASQTQSLLQSASQTQSLLQSASQTRSLPPSASLSDTEISPSKTHSIQPTLSKSDELSLTPLKQQPKTPVIQTITSAIIQQFAIILPHITHTQLSSSGELLLAQTSTGFDLVTISQDDNTMTQAGSLEIDAKVKGATFSRSEQHVFVATTPGDIQVFDIRNPSNPQSIGTISTNLSIQSIASSSDGSKLLVGTNTGIQSFTIKIENNVPELTQSNAYHSGTPITSIRTNPHTNTVAVGAGKEIVLLDLTSDHLTKLSQLAFTSSIKNIAQIDQNNPSQLTVTLDNRDTVFLDLTNPKAVTVKSTIVAQSPTELTTFAGQTGLVAGVKPGIQIFNAKTEVGYSPVTNSVTSLEFASHGKFAIYSDNEGLKLIKVIKNPGRLDVPLPRLSTIVQLGFAISDVFINEANNWIALAGNHLTFIARHQLHHPTRLGSVNTTGDVKQMAFFPDKTKLLLADSGGIAYVNCFNPEAPRLLGRWNSNQPIYELYLTGSYAYLSQGENGITVIDVTNPLNMKHVTTLETTGAAQALRFNRNRTLAYVADSTGIDIWSAQSPLKFQRLSRLNSTGFVSDIALSEDEKTLYFSHEYLLGQANVSSPLKPILSHRLDTTYKINRIHLSRQGNAAYLATALGGTLIVDTKAKQVKHSLPSLSAKSMALTQWEDQLFIAAMNQGLQVADLVSELPIIPLTARTAYPVGIRIEEPLLFFNQTLKPISIDRVNSIKYMNSGQKTNLPLWISADLEKQRLFITAPKELSSQQIQLSISLDSNSLRQETLYQAQIIPSLAINADKGPISVVTPSPTVSVNVNLTQGSFIPKKPGSLSVSVEGNVLKAFGLTSDVNDYLQSVRVNPSPITQAPDSVALSPAHITATDSVNLHPASREVPLRSFRFNQPPVVANAMNQTSVKAKHPFSVTIPPDTVHDLDDPQLTFSAHPLPPWLLFSPDKAMFSGEAPKSMLNQTLTIQVNASDGYLWAITPWRLHVKANHPPVLSQPIPAMTCYSGQECSYTIPANTFQDPDNDTLTYTAAQESDPLLPSFCNFHSERNPPTLLCNPTTDTIGTYRIKFNVTDEFDASALALFDLHAKFSNSDFFWYVFDRGSIVAGVLTFLFGGYYNRAWLSNCIKTGYWRKEIPPLVFEENGYTPTHPSTGKLIESSDIAKVQLLQIDKNKCGYEFASKKFPLGLYISQYAQPLVNNESLPSWVKYHAETNKLRLSSTGVPNDGHTYILQVIDRDDYILESFALEHMRVFMDQIDISMSQFSDSDSQELLNLPAHSTPSATATTDDIEETLL